MRLDLSYACSPECININGLVSKHHTSPARRGNHGESVKRILINRCSSVCQDGTYLSGIAGASGKMVGQGPTKRALSVCHSSLSRFPVPILQVFSHGRNQTIQVVKIVHHPPVPATVDYPLLPSGKTIEVVAWIDIIRAQFRNVQRHHMNA